MLLDSLNSIYCNDLTAVRYVSQRTEATELKVKVNVNHKRVFMSQQELKASNADEIDTIKKLIKATDQLTELAEAASAKTADELEEARTLIEGLQKQRTNSKKK